MRFSTTILALATASLSVAQIPAFPQCSLNCFVTALGGDGCSALTDVACHCQKTGIVSTFNPCVQKACDTSDQKSVSSMIGSLCSSVGHPVSVPPVEEPSTTSPSSNSAVATTTASGAANTSDTASSPSSASAAASLSNSGTTNGASKMGVGLLPVAGGVLAAAMAFDL